MLDQVRQGASLPAPRVVIYGVEGIGKSTMGAAFPGCIFADCEGGLEFIGADRVAIQSGQDFRRLLGDLYSQEHGYKTLVVDTMDALESILKRDLCQQFSVQGLADFDFGQGYSKLEAEAHALLRAFDALAREKQIGVVLLAHAMVKRFDAPDQEKGFDRYTLQLEKKVEALVKAWPDALLFCKYETLVVENKQKQAKGVGGTERRLYAQRRAGFDAKNRHGMPESMDFNFNQLNPYLYGGSTHEQ